MKNITENKMGVLPVGRLLFTMSLPAMISMLIYAMYNIVDSFFVARISENALSAVTLVFPVQMLMVAVGTGTGVGLSSLIARRLGEKRVEEANVSAAHGFLISLFNWVVFAILGIFLTKPFITLFSDDAEIVALAVRFCTILTVCSLFIFIQVTVEKILQATGNMLFPMIFNISGAIINIILNPVLIFGLFGAPALGIAGSATATIIAQFAAMSIGLFLLFRFKHAVKVEFKRLRRPQQRIFADIYAVGFPAIIMQAVMSITVSGMNAILIRFTSTAVAVFGVYYRIQSVVFMPVFGLNQGALPIMGYNFGARNKKRLMDGYKKATYVALVIMVVGMALFQLYPIQILQLFNASPDMLHIGNRAIRIMSICFIPAGFGIVTTTLFQALGHGFLSMIVSLTRQLFFVLPAAWLLGEALGVDYVWFAYPIAEVVAVLIFAFFLYGIYNKEIRNLGVHKE
ncbi:MAG: MATE family efflux transporter [Clostridiales Family XIII bacterium]|nr:MATE family efflux transporter [Clostridiales Family XIII bacterium]